MVHTLAGDLPKSRAAEMGMGWEEIGRGERGEERGKEGARGKDGGGEGEEKSREAAR